MAATIDEYIKGFPPETQKSLKLVRATIKKAAPGAEERISYAIAAFRLDEIYLIYFAGFKNHIGMYPVPAASKGFEKDYAPYKTSGRGSIQFPLDKPIPVRLITKIVKFKAKENKVMLKMKALLKAEKKKAKR